MQLCGVTRQIWIMARRAEIWMYRPKLGRGGGGLVPWSELGPWILEVPKEREKVM